MRGVLDCDDEGHPAAFMVFWAAYNKLARLAEVANGSHAAELLQKIEAAGAPSVCEESERVLRDILGTGMDEPAGVLALSVLSEIERLQVEVDSASQPEAKAAVYSLTASIALLNAQRDKALSDKDTQLALMTSQRDLAINERDAARSRVAELEANEPDVEVAKARSELKMLSAERDAFKGRMEKELVNVSRLESMCGLKGHDHRSLPLAANEDGMDKGMIYEKWKSLSGAAKVQFYRDNQSELDAYEKEARSGIRF